MDPLSDVLQTIRLSGVIYLRAHLGGAYGLEIPPPTFINSLIKKQSDEHRLVMFHIVRQGRGYFQVEGSGAQELHEGDLILVFDHLAHSVLDQPGRSTVSTEDLGLEGLESPLPKEVHFGEGERTMRLICGMLQFVERGLNPIFAALPPYLIIRAEAGPSSPWLQANLNYIIEEAEAGRAGTNSLLSRLTELLFIETLRAYLKQLPETEKGWFAALKDKAVGPALQLLHQHPERPWTVASLAKQVGVSRSGFSARFTELLDTSPIAYLYRWRIRQATNLLDETQESIAQIGARVGYDSESAFHRAFKREMGLSPSAFRNRAQASQ